MLEKYINLRKEVSTKELELKEFLLKGKSKIVELEKSLDEVQQSLKKGNGFSQILYGEYSNELEKTRIDVLKGASIRKGELEKSRRELLTLVKKNEILSTFENYSKIISVEDFRNSLLSLVKSHKNGEIDFSILEKAKESSLKFKEIKVSDKKYMVKDDRTNYSDMIIFNQDNKILFVKRNKDDSFEPGKYALPGGHVEPAENPLLAAVREVEEEIGLCLEKKLVSPVGVYEDTKVLINYFCTKIDDTLVNIILEERELQQYEWIELDKIGELDLLMNLKENFQNLIEIPSTVLKNPAGSEEISIFYGLPLETPAGTGYPI